MRRAGRAGLAAEGLMMKGNDRTQVEESSATGATGVYYVVESRSLVISSSHLVFRLLKTSDVPWTDDDEDRRDDVFFVIHLIVDSSWD